MMNKLNNSPPKTDHVVVISEDNWDYTRNCTVVFDVTFDNSMNLFTPSENSRAIKLDYLIYLGLRQILMDKLLENP